MGLQLDQLGLKKQPPPPQLPPQHSNSQRNAQLFAYYEQLIDEYVVNCSSKDKLALHFILKRVNRPTIVHNRELQLLDLDKMISLQHNSLNEGGERVENMRKAAELKLSRHLLAYPSSRQRGNFQLFRLIRAAQFHYRRPDQQQEHDLVNNSFEENE